MLSNYQHMLVTVVLVDIINDVYITLLQLDKVKDLRAECGEQMYVWVLRIGNLSMIVTKVERVHLAVAVFSNILVVCLSTIARTPV